MRSDLYIIGKRLLRQGLMSLAMGWALTGCIQKEEANKECDILSCTVPEMNKGGKYETLRAEGEVRDYSLSATQCEIYIKDGMLATLPTKIVLSPQFTLTEGASIVSENGKGNGEEEEFRRNADEPYMVRYTVTSEDGKWKKEYKVFLSETNGLVVINHERNFQFEYYSDIATSKNSYHHIYNTYTDENGEEREDHTWESANAGFAIVNGGKTADQYPASSIESGKSGRGVRLLTAATGGLGKMVNMPIAAGNFFIGSFDKTHAMGAPLESTRFGIKCPEEPTTLSFWYKAKRGKTMTDKEMNPVYNSDGTPALDYPDVYGVLFEPKVDANGNYIPLNGTNILTAENIIAIARIKQEDIILYEGDDLEDAPYNFVELNFERTDYVSPNVYPQLFLTLVFTSSWRGDYFIGAVGSELWLDDVTVKFKPTPNTAKAE